MRNFLIAFLIVIYTIVPILIVVAQEPKKYSDEEIKDFIETAERRRLAIETKAGEIQNSIEQIKRQKRALEGNMGATRKYLEDLRDKAEKADELRGQSQLMERYQKKLDDLNRQLVLKEKELVEQSTLRVKFEEAKKAAEVLPQKGKGLIGGERGYVMIPREWKIPGVGKIICKKAVKAGGATCAIIAFDIGGLYWLSKEEKAALERFNSCMQEKLASGIPEERAYLDCSHLLEKSVIGDYLWYYFNDRLSQFFGSMGISEIIRPIEKIAEKERNRREQIQKDALFTAISREIKKAYTSEQLQQLREAIRNTTGLNGKQKRELQGLITKRKKELNELDQHLRAYYRERGIDY